MKQETVKISKNSEKRNSFSLNSEYRFKLNFKGLSKNHKEIIKLDKNLYNKIKFNRPLKSVYRGSNNISDNSINLDKNIWKDLLKFTELLNEDLSESLFDKDWYVSSITLSYLYDVTSIKGSPDYSGYTDKSLTDMGKCLLDKFITYSRDILNIERISKKKYICVINWFTHYLYKIKNNCIMSLIYTRDEGFRSTFNVSNTDYSYSVLIRFIDFLREEGMVLSFTGNKLYSCSVGSMLVINPSIFSFIGNCTSHSDTKVLSKEDNKDTVLKMTCSDGKEISPDTLKDDTYYKSMYKDADKVLSKYHSVMDLSEPRINGYPLSTVRLHRTIKETYGESSRWFDNGSFQGKPKDVRKMLTLLDEKTVSLDFKSLHPAILMYYKGVSLKDHDPYPKISGVKVSKVDVNRFKKYYGLDKYDPLRNLVKKLFLSMINADSINDAVGSMYDDLRKDNLKKGTFREHTMKYIGLGEVDLHKVAKKILRHNKIIKEYLGTGEGKKLQFKDSNIIRYCLDKLSDEKIPCIPVHDSISCRVSDKETVKSVMREAFVLVVGEGSENNCIIEEE